MRAKQRASYDELDYEAKRRYCALGVFETDFGVGAAAAVSGLAEPGQDVREWMSILKSEPASDEDKARQAEARKRLEARAKERLDQTRALLEGLCGRSLIAKVPEDRYRLDGAQRDFARGELRTADAEEAAYHREAAYLLGYVQQHRQDKNALDVEWRNVEGVLEWLEGREANKDRRTLMAFVQALAFPGFLDRRGHGQEAIRWGDAAAGAASRLGDYAAAAGFSCNVGTICRNAGDHTEARKRYEESLRAYRRLGDDRNTAMLLYNLGALAHAQGAHDEARRLCEESLEIKRSLGDQAGIAAMLHHLGVIAHRQGKRDEARRRYEESLEIKRKLGDQAGIATTLGQMERLAEA
ncbi:MAG TPA: tetratricopeptide repeat protein [Anaerolineae bacterium]|nr:tetratricopeptide repeat protein [Anaerolineae bacterium]